MSMLSPGSSSAPGLWQEGLLGGGLGPEEGDQTPEVSPLSRLRRHLVQGENLQRHSGPGEGAASIHGGNMVFLCFSWNLGKLGIHKPWFTPSPSDLNPAWTLGTPRLECSGHLWPPGGAVVRGTTHRNDGWRRGTLPWAQNCSGVESMESLILVTPTEMEGVTEYLHEPSGIVDQQLGFNQETGNDQEFLLGFLNHQQPPMWMNFML